MRESLHWSHHPMCGMVVPMWETIHDWHPGMHRGDVKLFWCVNKCNLCWICVTHVQHRDIGSSECATSKLYDVILHIGISDQCEEWVCQCEKPSITDIETATKKQVWYVYMSNTLLPLFKRRFKVTHMKCVLQHQWSYRIIQGFKYNPSTTPNNHCNISISQTYYKGWNAFQDTSRMMAWGIYLVWCVGLTVWW